MKRKRRASSARDAKGRTAIKKRERGSWTDDAERAGSAPLGVEAPEIRERLLSIHNIKVFDVRGRDLSAHTEQIRPFVVQDPAFSALPLLCFRARERRFPALFHATVVDSGSARLLHLRVVMAAVRAI